MESAESTDGDDLPPAPRLRSAIRAAAGDFYYHSIQLVAVNLVWGLALVVLVGAWASTGPAGLILAPFLALPWVAVVRLSALIARGERADLRFAGAAARRWIAPALVAGFGFVVAAFVLLTNLGIGLQFRGIAGSAFAGLSVWGLLIAWALALSYWPLLVDPRRADVGARAKARLAALVLIAFPVRMAALGVVAAVISVLGALTVVPIATIAVSSVALLASRFVLPAADRLEHRRVPADDED